VARGQFRGIEAGMGHIATAPAGNADFAQKMSALFQDGDIGPGPGFGARDGRKKSGRAPARHHDASRSHATKARIPLSPVHAGFLEMLFTDHTRTIEEQLHQTIVI
jgi:hypothetical protein